MNSSENASAPGEGAQATSREPESNGLGQDKHIAETLAEQVPPCPHCENVVTVDPDGCVRCENCVTFWPSLEDLRRDFDDKRKLAAQLASTKAAAVESARAKIAAAAPGPQAHSQTERPREKPRIDNVLHQEDVKQMEVAVLGAILLDPSCMEAVRKILDDTAFSSSRHARIFIALCALIDRGIKPDILTLTDELQETGYLPSSGGPSYIASLTSAVPTSANVEYYANRVAEASGKRRLHKLIETLTQDTESSLTVEEVTEKTKQVLDGINAAGQAPIIEKLISFHDRQVADIAPRIWFVDKTICPGFCMLTGKKAMGKSYLMMQIANAIAEGSELLGRATTKAKVLFVSFELDEHDTAERFRGMQELSENAYIVHGWSTGDKALKDAERVIKDLGIKVLMFDTFLPMLPRDKDFQLNEYGDTECYLKWRQLGKRNDAAIIASWHEGKNPRDDFMLNAIGSTGMVAQADCVISIDRRRGEAAGRIFTAGNHAKDSVISVVFEDGLFKLGEGEIRTDRLTPDEEKTMGVLARHPEGATPTGIGLETGRNDNAARAALNRLIARRKVIKIKRGLYGIARDPDEQPELGEAED